MSKLIHRTIFEAPNKVSVNLPLSDELRVYHPQGTFPLVEDPKTTKRASIVGMFVLRPTKKGWTQPILQDQHPSFYDVAGWGFNVKGADGGWLIANGNVVDAYRLALQYGVSDAVMVGSTTVAKEGTPHGKNPGHLWQPYGPTSWGHLHAQDPDLLVKIMRQRGQWQAEGYLSDRKYPAQIVITQSGKESTPDILDARIFHEKHPDGQPIEAYILTSKTGAERIRSRAMKFGLEARMDDILIVLSPDGQDDVVDLKRVPQVLYDDYEMRIVNHDGGQTILSEFARAGVLPQINLTLARGNPIYEVLQSYELKYAPMPMTEETRKEILASFEERVQYFFPNSDLKIPKEMVPVQILTDSSQDVAVVTFDTRALAGKGL